jgi:phosphotransferase system enzyme I (PtsP)
MRGALGGPRVLLRRLREVMAEPVSAQERLDKIVVLIAANMVAEVCSVYVLRVDSTLELYATEGLNRDAVHHTVMRSDEGLVGLVASQASAINLSNAQAHPAFSFRPETGEEIYHSFLGVPILRAGNTLGVLVVQNRARRTYSEEEVEALQTTAMVLAEMIASGELSALAPPGAEPAARRSLHLTGKALSEGIALGHVVLHEPRVVVTNFIADDIPKELKHLESAVETLRAHLDELLEHGDVAEGGEHRDVLEAYRMFAYDRGWVHKLEEAVMTGLTAEAAVERVQSDTRARMLRQTDPYLRERLHDLDDLANRLMRQLTGRDHAPSRENLPENAILVARSMGPAALLDYDRKRLRGLVLEEGGPHSHVAIVARALGIPAVGEIDNATGIADPGDAIIVDGSAGDLHIRPLPDMEAAYAERVRLRARRQQQYQALRDLPCVTKDGEEVTLLINAGLSVDLPHIADTGAAGIGLFRTELQFMVAPNFPRASEQYALYRAVLDAAGDKPVTFRTLDIGGDKVLPYMRNIEEENPALGWRAIRLGLDRPALLRTQLRALLRAAGGRALKDHVSHDRDRCRIRPGQGAGRARAHASAPPRPQAARRGRGRQHGRGPLAALSARRIARARRLPLGRLERPRAIPLRRRSRQSAGVRPLRSAVGAGVARAQGHCRQMPRAWQAGDAVRRACLATDRRAGAGRHRLPRAVAHAVRDWAGQGDAARLDCRKAPRFCAP